MVPIYVPPSWQVVNGPNREQLFDALRLRDEERTVKFEFIIPSDDREELEIKILAIEANDADMTKPNGGKTWIVKGIDIHPDTQGDRICLLYYNTQNRTGTIQVGATGLAGPSLLSADEQPREGLFVFIELKRHGMFYVGGEEVEGDFQVAWLVVGPFSNSDERKEFLKNFPKLLEEYDAPEGAIVNIAATNVIHEMYIPVMPKDFSMDMLKEHNLDEDDFWEQGSESPDE